MNVLIVGNNKQRAELIASIPKEINYSEVEDSSNSSLADFDCIFDLDIDNHPEKINQYKNLENKLLVFSAVKLSLLEYQNSAPINNNFIVGLNTLIGFINRPVKELSFLNKESEDTFRELNTMLGWDYEKVLDRVGMVSPRVVLMIINEACYTLQEGTADISAIDQAMKLGTNYPKGPFEWADEIGIKDVYLTLKAIFEDTGDERYKICPLLKKHYLAGKSFY